MPVDHVNGVELYWEQGGSGPRLLFATGRAPPYSIRGAEPRGYEGGHLFLFQDPAALPEFEAFLQAPPSTSHGA